VSTSLQTVIAEKLTGFQLTKTFQYRLEPELSLQYTVLKNKIEILRSLKSGKTDFNNSNMTLSKYFNYNFNHICKLLPNTLTYKLHTSKEHQGPQRWPKTEAERCGKNK